MAHIHMYATPPSSPVLSVTLNSLAKFHVGVRASVVADHTLGPVTLSRVTSTPTIIITFCCRVREGREGGAAMSCLRLGDRAKDFLR